jgi:F-type H+-transporting ATPase subunit b
MATETKAGHTATAHEGGKPPFPPFQSETFAGQLVWLALTFGLLYLFLSRVALPRLGAVIDERHKKIAKDIETAAASKKAADEAQLAYETALNNARKNAQAIAQETRDKLTAETETKRKAVERDLHAKLEVAEKQIAATKARAMGNVETIATDAAAVIIERLTGHPAQPSALAGAVKTAVKG